MVDIQAVATKEADLRRQIRRINIVLLAVLAMLIIGPAILSWWVARQLPVVNAVEIENVQMLSSAELCPGEPLVYQYAFHAKGAGVLVRDRVLWRTNPPKTLVYSVSRRFILSDPIDQELTEAWHIPRWYVNPETDRREMLPPGNYRMIFAISSPSRSTVVDIDAVEFTIREDCNE